jgi:hypothetical protein
MHWTELNRLQAVGGAVLRKYERLVEQAHGATSGSSAQQARMQFENAWMADPEAVKAECEAEDRLPEPKPLEPVKLVPEIKKAPSTMLTFAGGED